MATEACIPNPEYLIKSLAEQGYSLETSIADLIDNSISAGADNIEVLIDLDKIPFTLFITDNGCGMTKKELKRNMNFPSVSMEDQRNPEDLGRFGLGLKTASFAQTRSFTVISRKKGEDEYNARTWDVEHLKNSGNWEVLINSKAEIKTFIEIYRRLCMGFLNPFKNYLPNTIIIWHGLYKFEHYASNEDKYKTLRKELTETTKEYLQLIFHRFLERESPVKIRLNNEILTPFNPFPKTARKISPQRKSLLGNKLFLEGLVLPNRSLIESKGASEWTMTHKSLMDMEGIYVYRADRIIVFGGWNGLIKKSPRLQLARLKVEIGNGIDHLFHLNVAKSSIMIPFAEKIAFIRYVSELKSEAEKEFFNHGIGPSPKKPIPSIFLKMPTNIGMALKIDQNFPILNTLMNSLSEEQKGQLKIILRMITTTVNKVKRVYAEDEYSEIVERDGINNESIALTFQTLLAQGISKKMILDEIIPNMGFNSKSLPTDLQQLLKD